MKKYVILLLSFSILTCSIVSFAQSSSSAPNAKASTSVAPSTANSEPTETFAEYDSKKLWLAIPMGYIVGFGSGHMVQGRFHDYGYWWAIADGLGWFLIASGAGSCDIGDVSCQNSQEDRQTMGRTILMASHFTQMVDTAIWGYKYKMEYDENSTSYNLIPTPQGILALATFRF